MTNRLALTCLLVVAACDLDAGDPDVSAAQLIESAPHIQYYGYYGDDGLLSEVAGHANFTHIYPGSAEDGVPALPLVREARERGMKVMLNVQSVFGVAADGSMRPEGEWQAKWAAYVANIGPYVNPETVAAFWMYDEPSATSPEFWRTLERTARIVRETFPGIPIAMGYGWWHLHPIHVDNNFVRPEGFDWFGFNCYGPFDNCMFTGASITQLLDNLEARLLPGQRVLLIPEASNFFNIAASVPYDENDFIVRADQYLALAASRPSVIGYIPFMWSGQFGPTPNPAEWQLRHMQAATIGHFEQIGRAITGKGGGDTPPPPPPPPPPPSPRPAGREWLGPDQSLQPGDALTSSDGRFALAYQGDGNLVLYQSGAPLWSSGTAGTSANLTIMQGDGNLVIYDQTGSPVWSSGTPGAPGAALALQSDGNLVIYAADGAVLWTSSTCCR